MTLDLEDDFEYDEVDLQYYEQCRGPKLKSGLMRRSQDEINPTVWAEVLRQDVKTLSRFIDEERDGLRMLFHQVGSTHRTHVQDSLVVIHGFKHRSSELQIEMSKWDDEFPTNPTLVEGVIALDENTGNSRSRTELRQSKKMMMDLLHRPDVLNFKERKQLADCREHETF